MNERMTHVKLPDYLLWRRPRLNPAVEVDVAPLVNAVGGDGRTKDELHSRRILNKNNNGKLSMLQATFGTPTYIHFAKSPMSPSLKAPYPPDWDATSLLMSLPCSTASRSQGGEGGVGRPG